jgi:hypothetical protein
MERKLHSAPTAGSEGPLANTTAEGLGISNLSTAASAGLATVTFGGSAPASPMSNVAVPSPSKKDLSEQQYDMDCLSVQSEEDEEEQKEERSLTAAELRSQKRKMKRFRLTHNQTRFLMSEFARQAHPDAAHRERLAREIPGLSSRQVQVWFQNR